MSTLKSLTNIIKSLDSSTQKKKDENETLYQQEQKNQKLLTEQGWEIFYLKMKLGRQKKQIDSFLKDNGGLFNLNNEQQTFYSQLLNKENFLSGSLFNTKKSNYSLKAQTISLHNRQMSNYSIMLNNTFDKADYLNQQALLEKHQAS